MTKYAGYYQSNIGYIYVEASDKGITKTEILQSKVYPENKNSLINQAIVQLDEYFNKKRKQFDLPLVVEGTPFQVKVWNELLKIPYGQTCSYQDIAVRIDNIKAVRAVGGANNKNKIGIIIPCHRVIGKNNKLVGYASGLDHKEFLLALEHE